jgi:DNA-binding MarR family transcriptional regulator
MRNAARAIRGDDPTRRLELDEAMELFQAAHRSLEESSRILLAKRGLGRTHQRILYLIGRTPGQSVSDMLGRLQVTKQALNTPLNQLKRKGLVRARRQPGNGRRKQLFLTQTGEALEQQLSGEHRTRLASAFRIVGSGGERRWKDAMRHLADGDLTFAPLRSQPNPQVLRAWMARRRLAAAAKA